MISSGFELAMVGEEGPPLEPVEEQPKAVGSASVDGGACTVDLGVTQTGVPTEGDDTGV